MKRVLLLLILLIHSRLQFAKIQEPLPNRAKSELVYKNYHTQNSNLQSNGFYRVFQDNYGFLWFASERGLLYFDGLYFRTIPQTEHLEIVSWYVQNKTHIWLFGYNGTLKCYDINQRQLIDYGNPSDASEESIRMRPFLLGFTIDSLLYFSKFTNKELTILNKNTKNIVARHHDFSLLHQYLQKKFDTDQYEFDKHIPHPSANYIIPEGDKSILMDGKIYTLDSNGHSSIIFDGSLQGGLKNITHFERNQNDLYISVWDIGLLKYSNYFPLKQVTTIDTILTNERVTNFLFDKNNQLWVTTINKGIFQLNGSIPEIKKLNFPPYLTANTSVDISAIHSANNTVFFLQNNSSNYFTLDLHTNSYTLQSSPGLQHLGKNMIGTTKQQTWGLFQSGLYAIDPTNNNLFQKKNVSDTFWLTTNNIKDIVVHEAYIYYTNRLSIYQLDGVSQKKVLHFHHKNISSFAYFQTDSFLIGTTKGLYLNNNKLSILQNEVFKKIIPYKNGFIAATQTGLYQINRNSNNQWGNTLLSPEVFRQLQTNDSLLFCLGENSSAMFSLPQCSPMFRMEASAFPEESTYFNTIHLKNNLLYLGTSKGIYTLPISSLGDHTQQAPDAYITFNNIFNSNKDTSILYSADLELNFALDVINLQQQNLLLSYSIHKNNEPWILQRLLENKDNTFVLKGLEPGTYTISYLIESSWQTWKKEVSLRVIIQKRWWQQTWFIILLTLLIVLLAATIIRMIIKRYQRQINAKASMEQRLFELETTTILSQLKPHFIFNALTPIQYYLLQNDKKNGLLYLDKFSKLMRSLLDGIRSRNIVLEKEISFIKDYLHLQKERFQHSFDYEITVAPNINTKEVLLPNMLLQPILENAIEHGLENVKQNGFLKIKFDKTEEELIITISDNGIGFDTAQLFKPNCAMTIIQEHIHLLKKKTGFGLLSYTSELGKGSHFNIRLPLLKR